MKNQSKDKLNSQDIELNLLLEGMYLKYGYDFRNYSRDHVRRRIQSCLEHSEFENISQLQHEMLLNPDFFQGF